MRFLSWLITLPVPVLVMLFALQNREQVELTFWPFDVQIAMPLSFLAVGLTAIGVVVGVLSVQFALFRMWREKRKCIKTIKNLERQVSEYKEKAAENYEATNIPNQDRIKTITHTRERIE